MTATKLRTTQDIMHATITAWGKKLEREMTKPSLAALRRVDKQFTIISMLQQKYHNNVRRMRLRVDENGTPVKCIFIRERDGKSASFPIRLHDGGGGHGFDQQTLAKVILFLD
jgi:hypothetical protein